MFCKTTQTFSKTFCGLVFALVYFTLAECYFCVIVALNFDVGNPTVVIGEVCEAVRRQWGSTYTVVLTEDQEIDDTNATQGLCSCSAHHGMHCM